MKELKFVLYYDYTPDDCIEKIEECLNQIGYQITFSDREDPENGSVEYKIIPL